MRPPLTVLCVGLAPLELERLRREWPDENDVAFETVPTAQDLPASLDHLPIRLILADYSVDRAAGWPALQFRNARAPELPLIFLADAADAEAARNAGASDVALRGGKRNLREILGAFRHAGPGADAALGADEAMPMAALAFRRSPDVGVVFRLDPGGKYVVMAVNAAFTAAAARSAGPSRESDWIGKTLRELVAHAFPFSRRLYETASQRFLDAALAGQPLTDDVQVEGAKDIEHFEQVATPIIDSDLRCRYLIWSLRDIGKRKMVQAAVRAEEARLREAALAMLSLARGHGDPPEDPIRALKEMLAAASRAANVARCGIWLFNQVRSRIRCLDLYDLRTGEHTGGQEVKIAEHPGHLFALLPLPLIAAPDAARDPRTREFNNRYFAPLGVTSWLAAAMRVRGERMGVVCLEHVGAPRPWVGEEEIFVTTLANVVALVLEAAESARIESGLRASQQKLRMHLMKTPLGVIEWDTKLEMTEWNPAAETIFGYGAYEAIGRTSQLLCPEGQPDQLQLALKQVLITGAGQRVALRHQRKDGAPIDCEWHNTPLSDETGQIVGAASLVQDVTLRLNAERALKASEERFGRAFMTSPLAQGISRLADRRFIAINDAGLALLSKAREELLGKTVEEMGVFIDADFQEQAYTQLQAGAAQAPQEIRIRLPSGVEAVGLAAAHRIDSDGEPCVLWCFENLTAQRRAEKEVERLRAELDAIRAGS
jgi:PAS domain S-box-containing protein